MHVRAQSVLESIPSVNCCKTCHPYPIFGECKLAPKHKRGHTYGLQLHWLPHANSPGVTPDGWSQHHGTHRGSSSITYWGLTPEHHEHKQGIAVLQRALPNGVARQSPSSPSSRQGRKQKPSLRSRVATGLGHLGSSLPLLHEKKRARGAPALCGK